MILYIDRLKSLNDHIKQTETNINNKIQDICENFKQETGLLKSKLEARIQVIKKPANARKGSQNDIQPDNRVYLTSTPEGDQKSFESLSENIKTELKESINSVKNEILAILRYTEDNMAKDSKDSKTSLHNYISTVKISLENKIAEIDDKFA